MKKTLKRAVIFCAASILASVTAAQAAYISITPAGSYDVTGMTSITFDVTFTVEGGDAISDNWGWDYMFAFDSTELGYQSTTMAGTVTEGADTLRVVNLASASSAMSAGPNLLGQFTFDILSLEIWDGMSDFEILSQIGTGYGLIDQDFNVIQLAGVQGADVGAPVPVPGAIWLLGSGFVGLVGLRRKVTKRG